MRALCTCVLSAFTATACCTQTSLTLRFCPARIVVAHHYHHPQPAVASRSPLTRVAPEKLRARLAAFPTQMEPRAVVLWCLRQGIKVAPLSVMSLGCLASAATHQAGCFRSPANHCQLVLTNSRSYSQCSRQPLGLLQDQGG